MGDHQNGPFNCLESFLVNPCFFVWFPLQPTVCVAPASHPYGNLKSERNFGSLLGWAMWGLIFNKKTNEKKKMFKETNPQNEWKEKILCEKDTSDFMQKASLSCSRPSWFVLCRSDVRIFCGYAPIPSKFRVVYGIILVASVQRSSIRETLLGEVIADHCGSSFPRRDQVVGQFLG